MKKYFTASIIQDKEEKKIYRWQVSASVLVLFIVGALLNIPFSREVKRLNIECFIFCLFKNTINFNL